MYRDSRSAELLDDVDVAYHRHCFHRFSDAMSSDAFSLRLGKCKN